MMGGGGGRWGGQSGPPRQIKPETKKRVLESFKPYKGSIALIVVCVIASAGISLMPPFFLRTIINHGLLARNLEVVTKYSLLSLAATLGSTAFTLAFGYLSIVVGQNIMRDFRDRLYDHLQGMSLRFFAGTRTGEIQSRLANDVSGVQSVLSDSVSSLLSNITLVVSKLIVMFIMDWRLTLLSIGVLPIFAFIGAKVGDVARGVRGKVQTDLADMSAIMQETLSVSGVLLTKTSGRRELTRRKFHERNLSLTGAQIKQAMIMRYFFNLIGLTFSITPVLVYWLAGYLIAGHGGQGLTVGLIVAFTSLQAGIFFPLTTLLNTQVDLSSSLALFDRIFEYLDMEQEIKDSPNAVDLDPATLKGNVEFRDVYFRYAEDSKTTAQAAPGPSSAPSAGGQWSGNGRAASADRRMNSAANVEDSPSGTKASEWTLQDLSFTARSGQLVALVGHSGAGKTTLTYLIPRLYDVDEGSVTIDGHDVRDVKLDSLGQIIGVVTQETYLVHDTIRENLRYGKPDATDDELISAARTAAIHEHIASLPEGYDTVVGERGYKLSGGEKQRIAIARAVLKNPRILILDEATSSLDTQSERLIQAALTPLMSGRTTFAIAHRLSTILAADLILVMEKGRIVERGGHDELLAKGGAYAALYAAQFENAVVDEAVG